MNEPTDRLDLHPLDLRRIPRDLPSSEYKLGDEFKPFHPSASHVPPDYRDGWNRCWLAVRHAASSQPLGPDAEGCRLLDELIASWREIGNLPAQCERRIQARAAVEAAWTYRAGAWRPIETAPKDGQRVLLGSPQWVAPNSGHWGGRGWELAYELGPFAHQPTHWMPLPALPAVARIL